MGWNSRCGRPYHHGNLLTHNALLRRKLIKEAQDDFHTTTLTKKGLKAVYKYERQNSRT